MKIKQEKNSSLAVSIYVLAMRKKIEKELESKYSKRIDYLVGANNELARKLEECEKECTKMTSIADNIVLDKKKKVYSDGRGGLYEQHETIHTIKTS